MNGKKVKVIFLFEHKTVIDRDIYLQLGTYLFEMLKSNFENNGTFEVIIPIVVYQGTAKYDKEPFYSYFENAETIFLKYIPHFDFELVSLQKIKDSDLLKIATTSAMRSVLLTMKNVHRKRFIKQYFEEFLVFAENNSFWDDLFKQIIVYLANKSPLKKEEMEALISKQKSVKAKSKGMTAYEEFLLAGEMRGKVKLIREAWLEGYKPDAVSRLTKMTVEEIKRLYKQFELELKTQQ